MGSVNKVFIIGNLGRDAEMRETQGGHKVVNFSVATTERWKSRDGEAQERTEWHRCVAWNKVGEAVQPYLTKGKQVCVEGSLETRDWVDRDENKRQTTEIKATRITLLGGRRDDERESRGGAGYERRPDGASQDSGGTWSGSGAGGGAAIDEDDIPF